MDATYGSDVAPLETTRGKSAQGRFEDGLAPGFSVVTCAPDGLFEERTKRTAHRALPGFEAKEVARPAGAS